MSLARSNFISGFTAFEDSATSSALTDQAPTNHAHNAMARLLRNGLAVVGFALLEEFLKARTAELTTHLASAGAAFSTLPDDLKTAFTFGTIKALQFQAENRRRQRDDPTPYVQQHAAHVSSTIGHPFTVSDLAFGADRSNLGHEDIKNILAAFLVKDGWGNVTRFSSRAGLSIIALDQTFRNAAARRHKAAHRADAQIPQADLTYFRNEAFAIALGFDAVLSHATRMIRDRVSVGTSVDQANIAIRFLDQLPTGAVRERVENSSRAYKKHADLASAKAAAEPRATARREVVIVRTAACIPIEWIALNV